MLITIINYYVVYRKFTKLTIKKYLKIINIKKLIRFKSVLITFV